MLEFVLCRSGMGGGISSGQKVCAAARGWNAMWWKCTKVPWDLGCWEAVIMAQADCSGLWELENESSEHSHLGLVTAGSLSVL